MYSGGDSSYEAADGARAFKLRKKKQASFTSFKSWMIQFIFWKRMELKRQEHPLWKQDQPRLRRSSQGQWVISIELGKPRRARGFLGDSWNQPNERGPKVKLSPALERETPFLFHRQSFYSVWLCLPFRVIYISCWIKTFVVLAHTPFVGEVSRLSKTSLLLVLVPRLASLYKALCPTSVDITFVRPKPLVRSRKVPPCS